MLKLKHSFLLLVVAFLAACVPQAELPEAVAATDEQLGQISAAATELEQAFASSELSAQGNTWDKKKYNKFILKKVVEGSLRGQKIETIAEADTSGGVTSKDS